MKQLMKFSFLLLASHQFGLWTYNKRFLMTWFLSSHLSFKCFCIYHCDYYLLRLNLATDMVSNRKKILQYSDYRANVTCLLIGGTSYRMVRWSLPIQQNMIDDHIPDWLSCCCNVWQKHLTKIIVYVPVVIYEKSNLSWPII